MPTRQPLLPPIPAGPLAVATGPGPLPVLKSAPAKTGLPLSPDRDRADDAAWLVSAGARRRAREADACMAADDWL
ncbi:hypothetical protein CDA63_19720 [Hymenobacter amundsenii]|uniref:Uncharacterized protein n=1 Tax=Hymenobacter amundsenii TaxID=2006685 RepID=A0A246FFU7_9BACT|nr:hypothetical protein [Hymenobacter amundsenii]OWP61381.1 hypothetical protein CDA63_19720 [Hymenobacter amundsenii]